MPKIAIYKFLTFFIFAFDAINEPPHLHIAKEKGNRQRSAKIWLETLKVAEKGSLTDTDLKQAIKVIKENQVKLMESFNNVKAGKKITTINKTMCIEKVLFDLPGKITLKMEDGRMIISPLKYFPDLQKLSVDKRKKHTIVDDRTILFTYSDAVYHLEDFIGLEANWRKR
jgi:hypothetical protein